MHNDKKRCKKNRKIRGVRVKIEEYQFEPSEDWSSSKRDGNNKNKNGKMGKNHGDEMSQVRRNKNNNPKREYKREQ